MRLLCANSALVGVALLTAACSHETSHPADAHDHDHGAAIDASDVVSPADAHEHDHGAPSHDILVHDHVHPPEDVIDRDTDDAVRADALDAARSTARDLVVHLRGRAAHADRLVDLRLVGADDRQLSRAVLRGYSAEDSFTLLAVVPDGASRLDGFFDTNGNLAYDPPPTDETSRSPLPAVGPYTVTVRPEASPVDIGPGASADGTLTGHFSEFEVHVGVFFQLAVTPEGAETTRGFFRYRALSGAGRFDVSLPGVLREGERYTAAWFIDLNDNGVYDPRGDHGGNVSFTGRAAGVVFHHEHHANRTWIE